MAKSHAVTLIAGDGIGPEVARVTVSAPGCPRFGPAPKGPIATPIGGGFPSVNFRPVRRLPGGLDVGGSASIAQFTDAVI